MGHLFEGGGIKKIKKKYCLLCSWFCDSFMDLYINKKKRKVFVHFYFHAWNKKKCGPKIFTFFILLFIYYKVPQLWGRWDNISMARERHDLQSSVFSCSDVPTFTIVDVNIDVKNILLSHSISVQKNRKNVDFFFFFLISIFVDCCFHLCKSSLEWIKVPFFLVSIFVDCCFHLCLKGFSRMN